MISTGLQRLLARSPKLLRRLGRNAGSRQATGFRPRVELLETRWLPSLTVGPNVNVSKLQNNQSEASIAINPTNVNNLVAFSNEFAVASGIRVYVSNNGGTTWTSRVITNGDGLGVRGCCDTQAAFDNFGNLFVTYLDFVGANTAVKVLLSTDGGTSFSLLATLTSDGDQPSIAAGAGSVWVTYSDSAGTISAQGAAVTGLGAIGAFSAAQVAPSSSGGNFGNIAIGPSGQVLITYQNPSGGQGPSTIYVNLDADGLGPGGFGGRVTASGTNVGGFDFIPAQKNRSVDAEANLVYDRSGGAHNGRVYLVYTDESPNESNNTDILVRFSDNNGTTWSAPVRANDDTTTRSQFMPAIAVDQGTGNVALSWYDARNSGQNNTAQIFATVSTDGGQTFQANVRVSGGPVSSNTDCNRADRANNCGDYYTMEFVGGVFYPVWADNSNSTNDNPNGKRAALDIYTAKVTVTGPAAGAALPGGSPPGGGAGGSGASRSGGHLRRGQLDSIVFTIERLVNAPWEHGGRSNEESEHHSRASAVDAVLASLARVTEGDDLH
ncbi:MAG: exo-alpha-sialidase [Planctomycetes bacterium]|nr:exo-alpha-sialidase [Planctomycetota bacterium]